MGADRFNNLSTEIWMKSTPPQFLPPRGIYSLVVFPRKRFPGRQSLIRFVLRFFDLLVQIKLCPTQFVVQTFSGKCQFDFFDQWPIFWCRTKML